MGHPSDLSINDFKYILPEDKIAQFPLSKRDSSKLLIYTKEGKISEKSFSEIPDEIPAKSVVVMNNTRVFNARLLFKKATGAVIELFCLEPANNIPMEVALKQINKINWLCMIGNARKWKDEILELIFNDGNNKIVLKACKVSEKNQNFEIQFSWEPSSLSFSEILHIAGQIPLPPYMKRPSQIEDQTRYNTVYALEQGSVAAPTSGLHFTKEIIKKLNEKNIQIEYLTLHVGAGTFKPVKAEKMADHLMHPEQFFISKNTIKEIYDNWGIHPIISVGTTSLRTIESIYWLALKVIQKKINLADLIIEQWEPYNSNSEDLPNAKFALNSLLKWMDENELEELSGSTYILIAPGYSIRLVDGIITNFHQPESTLLLLVAAFIGDDWKKVYDYALENNFRFLSYGDSSLLFRNSN